MFLKGSIISGEFDEQMNEFSLQTIKHFNTQSTIKENQLKALFHYLQKHEGDKDGQVITLYDQMPIRLSPEEIKHLLSDLEKVGTMYH
jgi:hypothetical protein